MSFGLVVVAVILLAFLQLVQPLWFVLAILLVLLLIGLLKGKRR
jgi:hypothetical protein